VPARLVLACVPGDQPLADEVARALAAEGMVVERPDLAVEAAPDADLAVVLVTRQSSGTPELNETIEALAAAGLRTLLAWWDEDAPSDFLSEQAAEDEIFYACFLPRPHRAAALVERLRAELGAA